MTDDHYRQYIENQVHGGAIVNNNIMWVFRAIGIGRSGDAEIKAVLMSLPEDDFKDIQDKIEELTAKFEPDIVAVSKSKKFASLASKKRELTLEELKLKQNMNLKICQIIITHLNKIGQWWMKPERIMDEGMLSLHDASTE